ncbi:MAG: trpE(G) [Nocardia sp.]|uniref:anthranilate synthase component I n=1 Tax=Nocardia sp. TaxID=1821 RepID=UPI002638528A|nr:anthranilate synthase component I [Nocardia sp.]MCU1644916.1 trpE(G) [Nocardia sp.]
MTSATSARPRSDAADSWTTASGVRVDRIAASAGPAGVAQSELEIVLDRRRGMLWYRGSERALGYTDPPIEFTVQAHEMSIVALNARGRVLLPVFRRALADAGFSLLGSDTEIRVPIRIAAGDFPEEDRTRHVGVFVVVRAVIAVMAAPQDTLLGLYGAFGYDLLFHAEPIGVLRERDSRDRDLVLHLPDTIVEIDIARDVAVEYRYEFTTDTGTTVGLPRTTTDCPFTPANPQTDRDHKPGEYAEVVRQAMPQFRAGELFEVVPGQAFHRRCLYTPAELFRRLYARNPAPHSLFANLGDGEYLVGASPEMFVSVRRDQISDTLVVESAPISGTIARGRDALEDADQIRTLLNSSKDECELTMCTDVDRNDKARVCKPGTVQVTGRRTIEMYSELIHTVDHVRGELRTDRDALDAFQTHMWAVTVTGAPKLAAAQYIERVERSPRRWYGGATGHIGFDGGLDTTLTLRTIHVNDGVATIRAGATLLCASDPIAEEAETELKAKALLGIFDEPGAVRSHSRTACSRAGEGLRILLVDHRDSFVHTLADYLRRTGADVTTYRAGGHLPILADRRPDLIVLSPGPGRPSDFNIGDTLAAAQRLGIPVFGVCLGMQALIEYFGGQLEVLDTPVHGVPSAICRTAKDSQLLSGLPDTFQAGRYHSLYTSKDSTPAELRVTAVTDDSIVMAVEHRSLPFAGVQFHPESIMTASGAMGQRILDNVVRSFARWTTPEATMSNH